MTASALLLLQGCTTIHDASQVYDGGRFRPGDATSARVGEVMMDRFHYSAAPVARPQQTIPAASGRYAVPANYRLVGRRVEGELAYCSAIIDEFACFYDDDGDHVFDHVLVSNLGIASNKQVLETPVAYTPGQASNTSGFKSELVYTGRHGNDIDLLYRDYTDNMDRPTFLQELHFTLDAGGQTQVTYRDAQIKVLSADEQGIRYEIQHGFAE